jgi:uncharacterized protein (UPF0332 family)
MKSYDSTTLIKYRMEQAQIALDDAKYLLNGNRSPQSIVNRSYYAMFYATLALLQKAGKIPSKHTGVISLFDTEFVLKNIFPKELSKDLHKAFDLRQITDYKIIDPMSEDEAKEILEKAVRFVGNIREYINKQLTMP